MKAYPHHYVVDASAQPDGNVSVTSDGLSTIESAPPVEFGGPGDRWSPESLLVAAVADCFVLTFKAIARASKAEWIELGCTVEGTLDKEDRVTRFVAFKVRARLTIASGGDEAKYLRLLEKAEHACLITSSLIADSELVSEVIVAE